MIGLKNKVAVITGASRGIGRACALRMAELGAKIIVNYHLAAEKAEHVVKQIEKNGGQAVMFRADVSKKSDCLKLVEFALKQFKRIDILVNNAGIHKEESIDNLDEKVWDEVIGNNAKSVYILSVLAGQVMRQLGKGVIVNIGSVAGQFPRALNIAYAVSKGAIWTLTRALAIALAPEVRVNAVAPGRIETDMSPMTNSAKRSMVIKENLRRRIGQPEDIAKVVAFLASEEADWITGQTIITDGGSSII